MNESGCECPACYKDPEPVVQLHKKSTEASDLLRTLADEEPDAVAVVMFKDGEYTVRYNSFSRTQLVGTLEILKFDLLSND